VTDALSRPAALARGVGWLPSGLRGELLQGEPMSRHTTWRVGGPVERFYRPADRLDLSRFLAAVPESEPLYWCGFGSNLLVRDGGLRGTVICLHPGLVAIDIRATEGRIVVDAGAPCARVARLASRAGLVGAEFLAGVPGTIGGALTMNAGAHGGETWSLVAAVETIDRSGRIHQRAACQYHAGYRSVVGPPDEWFVGAVLRLASGDARAATGRLRDLLARRAASQPIGRPSCGSVFRNPPGAHAAALIESAGLKGQRLGGAEVSVKHANFIINADGGSANDIEALIQLVQRRVLEVHGVALEPECRIIGVADSAQQGGPIP